MLRNKLSALTSAALVIGLGLYPVLVYFGFLYFNTSWVALLLIALCVARLISFRRGIRKVMAGSGVMIICTGGILLALISIVRQSHDAMLFYPVVVNATMLFVFVYSLISPPSVIERFASIKEGSLPPQGVVYTRRETIVWVWFFLLNGATASYTALYSSVETWALYNGFVAYVLIGALLGGEYLVRTFVIRKHER
jgi:uncharacterized membrane protein